MGGDALEAVAAHRALAATRLGEAAIRRLLIVRVLERIHCYTANQMSRVLLWLRFLDHSYSFEMAMAPEHVVRGLKEGSLLRAIRAGRNCNARKQKLCGLRIALQENAAATRRVSPVPLSGAASTIGQHRAARLIDG
jgi:hypothetical protein